jgi:hypothetical protein
MTPLLKGIALGIGAGALLYVPFVVSRFLQAGSGKAVGTGVFIVVFTRPLFWVLLLLIFCAIVGIMFRPWFSK